MPQYDHLYRDPALNYDWEEGIREVRCAREFNLLDSVVAWSQSLRAAPADPGEYRAAIENLLRGKPRLPVGKHYAEVAPEDRFHRLVMGQPFRIEESVARYDDLSKESYGPVPTPVSFVPPLLDDLEAAGYMDDNAVLKEVGCGTGLTTAAIGLMKRTRMKLHGLDWNGVAIEVARRTAASLGLHDLSFEAGRAQQMDLSRGDIFYLHSPFKESSSMEGQFCRRLIAEARSRPLVVATLYTVTKAFRENLPQLNIADGYHGIALFGTRRTSADQIQPAVRRPVHNVPITAEA